MSILKITGRAWTDYYVVTVQIGPLKFKRTRRHREYQLKRLAEVLVTPERFGGDWRWPNNHNERINTHV